MNIGRVRTAPTAEKRYAIPDTSPDINTIVKKTDVALVINCIAKKLLALIGRIPATEHKRSSGNIGNKNI